MTTRLADYRDSLTVVDGGWSTILLQRGVASDVPAERANVADEARVGKLVRDYVAAGARVLTTNTFAANPVALKRRGIDADWQALNRAGVEIALRERGDDGIPVAGTMGPSGTIVAVKEESVDRLRQGFGDQAKALAEAGADWLLLETFSELEEILIAIDAVREAVPDRPLIASMTFDSGPQRTRTNMGAIAEDCAAALTEAGADAIGSNCGAGVATALPAVVALRANSDLPLWVRPSVGLPDLVDGRSVYPQTAEQFGTHVKALLDVEVSFIGGCCGVGPEHIRRLAALAGSRRRGGR